MEGDELKSYEKAGKVLKKALEFGEKHARPGIKIVELAEKIEAFIKDEGCFPAFPANIDVNEIAAHFTPREDFEGVLGENDLVKLDLGVHSNGFVTDSAVTVDLSGEHGKLIEAVENAVNAAVALMKPGMETGKIGKAIEGEIKAKGMKPVQNLCGHGVGQWIVHTPPSIPNIATTTGGKIEAGKVYAIEPFATTPDGAGLVGESGECGIFDVSSEVPTRSPYARKVLELAGEYNGLPFSDRWLAGKMTRFELNLGLKELAQKRALTLYPPLKERKNALVAQSEVCVIVTETESRLVWD